jgi:hypothetical protein
VHRIRPVADFVDAQSGTARFLLDEMALMFAPLPAGRSLWSDAAAKEEGDPYCGGWEPR